VTLEGSIGDRFSNFQLEEMVARVIGVRDVDNRVKSRRVQGPEPREGRR
jgi:osmotically-inducible protein OsmY